MSAPVYSIRGPLRGQDGRPVWTVVRLLEAPDGIQPRALAVAECISPTLAQAHAQALNDAAAKAAALTLV